MLCSAVGTVALGWRQVHDISQALQGAPRLDVPALSRPAGDAQTLLLIGSDQRFSERLQGARGRSDTMLLVRLDPQAGATRVLSVPRDLRLRISTPDGARIDKMNAAYAEGGAASVVETLRRQLGIEVNHVFEIGLGAFERMINNLGCVWVDVDRRYYHSNRDVPPSLQYMEINLQPGYQKLCGHDALTYVRHRHDDSDLFRSARQQEFLRQLAAQISPGGLWSQRQRILQIMRRYVRTDLRGDQSVLELLKLAVLVSGQQVRQLQWPEHDSMMNGIFYLENTPGELRRMRRQLLGKPKARAARRTRRAAVEPCRAPALQVLGRMGVREAYAPMLRPRGSIFLDNQVRAYELPDQQGALRPAYRLAMRSAGGATFGVQGMQWLAPPILHGPHSSKKVKGRSLQIYWDGSRPRLVVWQHQGWTYWITNTLDRQLGTGAMLATAASLRSA